MNFSIINIKKPRQNFLRGFFINDVITNKNI